METGIPTSSNQAYATMPAEARWQTLQDNAKQPTIGKLIDEAMAAISSKLHFLEH